MSCPFCKARVLHNLDIDGVAFCIACRHLVTISRGLVRKPKVWEMKLFWKNPKNWPVIKYLLNLADRIEKAA